MLCLLVSPLVLSFRCLFSLSLEPTLSTSVYLPPATPRTVANMIDHGRDPLPQAQAAEEAVPPSLSLTATSVAPLGEKNGGHANVTAFVCS